MFFSVLIYWQMIHLFKLIFCVVRTYPTEEEHKHGHDHAHGHSHDDAPKKKKKRVHNLSLVSSVGFTIVGLLDVALFNAFMSSLLQAKAADLYRTKGVLAFANQGELELFSRYFLVAGSYVWPNLMEASEPLSTLLAQLTHSFFALFIFQI